MSLDMSDSGFFVVENDQLSQSCADTLARAKGRLVVALDRPRPEDAWQLVNELGSLVSIYKIGLELILSEGGLNFARNLQNNFRKRIFLDMKLLDIPNTVENQSQMWHGWASNS